MYIIIFLLIIICSFFLLLTKPNSIINNSFNAYTLLLCLIVYIAFKIGGLELSTTNDMPIYFWEYLRYHQLSMFEALDVSNKEGLFTLIQWSLSKVSVSPVFFKVMSWITFVVIFITALRKMLEPNKLLVVFMGYITYFIFFSYVLNTMRQGLAIAILFIAISILISDKKQNKTFYISIISAPLIHLSSIPLSIALFILKTFNFKLNTLVIFWVGTATLYLTHLNKKIFSNISITFIESYSDSTLLNVYNGGVNRLDFFIFSLIILLASTYVLKRLTDENNYKVYEKLLKIYILFNAYFLLVGFVAYSDRIASYSWFLVPLLILLPLTTSKQYKPSLVGLVLFCLMCIGMFNGAMDILFK